MHPNRRQMILTFVAAFGLTTLTAGCASGGAGGEGRTSRDPDLISAEELADYSSLNCLEIVERLRPRWLQRRGSEQNPVVYQDGNRLGSAQDVLGSIPANDVQSLKYLDSSDATTRYGTGHVAGAIEISSRRR